MRPARTLHRTRVRAARPAVVTFATVGVVMLAARLQHLAEPQVLAEPRPAAGAAWYAGGLWKVGLLAWGLAALGAGAAATHPHPRRRAALGLAVTAALTSTVLLADDAFQVRDAAGGPWGQALLGAETLLFTVTVTGLWWLRPPPRASWLLLGTVLAAAVWLALDVGVPVPQRTGLASGAKLAVAAGWAVLWLRNGWFGTSGRTDHAAWSPTIGAPAGTRTEVGRG